MKELGPIGAGGGRRAHPLESAKGYVLKTAAYFHFPAFLTNK